MELLDKHMLREHSAAYDPFDLDALDKLTKDQRDRISRFDQDEFKLILADTFDKYQEAFCDLKTQDDESYIVFSRHQ
jgi:hypothetical protein